MIPNRASRWSSSVYILIGLAGAYGLSADLSWPPSPTEGLVAASLIMMTVLTVRSLRSGVLVDAHGLISRAELATRRLSWAEIVRFESRGSLLANQVGVVLVDHRWVHLQYNPYADDYVKLLEQALATHASEADRQAASDATARHVALPAQHPPRRIFTWRLAAGVVAYAALVALVVRLEVMPLDVVLTITSGAVIVSIWQAWSSRRKKG